MSDDLAARFPTESWVYNTAKKYFGTVLKVDPSDNEVKIEPAIDTDMLGDNNFEWWAVDDCVPYAEMDKEQQEGAAKCKAAQAAEMAEYMASLNK